MVRAVLLLAASSACVPLPQGGSGKADEGPSTALVTTERREGGAALVFIDESGRRVADLTSTRGQPILDRQPSYSPDGAWVAFASNRGRKGPEATSLWVVAARPGAEPIALTQGASVDRDPVWMPDGKSLVFSSDRGGSYDLYRLELDRDGDRIAARGQARQLTRSAAQSLAPAIAPDGSAIVYMEVEGDGRSTLWRVAARGGAATQITRGPTDVTPTFAADGKRIYFAARAVGRADSDIYSIDLQGNQRKLVVEEVDADQSGPRVSADGSLLFATAVYRSQGSGQPVLASIVVARLGEGRARWHALHDLAVVESRVGVALPRAKLDSQLLMANGEYGPSLRRALERALRDAAAEDGAVADE